MARKSTRWVSTGTIVLWAFFTAITIFYPSSPFARTAGFLAVAMLTAFGLVHGSRRFGFKRALGLFVIAVVISNIFENLSISTGFPFGYYAHTPASGPKIFQVPIIVGLIFFSLCYIAWTLATMLLGDPARPDDPRFVIATPVVASFIVVGWDICSDPIGATIGKQWLFAHGGAYFGVPLSNYTGWYICTWAIFQAFSVYLARTSVSNRPVDTSYWYEAAAFWGVMSMQYPMLLLANPGTMVVRDTGGWAWRSGDILQAAVIMSIYTMLAAAITSALVVTFRERPRA